MGDVQLPPLGRQGRASAPGSRALAPAPGRLRAEQEPAGAGFPGAPGEAGQQGEGPEPDPPEAAAPRRGGSRRRAPGAPGGCGGRAAAGPRGAGGRVRSGGRGGTRGERAAAGADSSAAARGAEWEERRAAGYLTEGRPQLSAYPVTKRLRRWTAATGDVCAAAAKEVCLGSVCILGAFLRREVAGASGRRGRGGGAGAGGRRAPGPGKPRAPPQGAGRELGFPQACDFL